MVPRCPEQERFPKASSGSAGAVGSVGVGIRLGTGEREAASLRLRHVNFTEDENSPQERIRWEEAGHRRGH